jgi:hypothetical protein
MYNGSITANAVTPSVNMKNRIINGAMVIDQRNAGASVSYDGSNGYSVDRWWGQDVTDGAFTLQRVTDAPAGFINSLKFTTTTADASLGSSQFARIKQVIEGFNIADLGWGTASAKTVTLSFWVKSSLTGTFGGALTNDATNRSYPFTYTISVANTWEYETITIAGDTTGTWLTNNGAGIQLIFGLGVGSTFSGTAGAWAASEFYSATGATSVIGTLSATWFLTGVQLEVGSTATSFDYRPYGTELALCQRYFEVVSMNGLGGSSSTTAVAFGCSYKVEKRTTPTVVNRSSTAALYSFYRPGLGSGDPSSVAITSDLGDSRNFNITLGNFSGLSNNQAWVGRYEGLFNASAEL